jgi:hypothetical protein
MSGPYRTAFENPEQTTVQARDHQVWNQRKRLVHRDTN